MGRNDQAVAAPVEVLAVLSDLAADMGDTPGTTGHQIAQVRAAVAELIEACAPVLRHDPAFDTGPEAHLRAALASVGGA